LKSHGFFRFGGVDFSRNIDLIRGAAAGGDGGGGLFRRRLSAVIDTAILPSANSSV
jgi:hypothetical protein